MSTFLEKLDAPTTMALTIARPFRVQQRERTLEMASAKPMS
jgi:hypothetical protein